MNGRTLECVLTWVVKESGLENRLPQPNVCFELITWIAVYTYYPIFTCLVYCTQKVFRLYGYANGYTSCAVW